RARHQGAACEGCARQCECPVRARRIELEACHLLRRCGPPPRVSRGATAQAQGGRRAAARPGEMAAGRGGRARQTRGQLSEWNPATGRVGKAKRAHAEYCEMHVGTLLFAHPTFRTWTSDK